MKFPTEKENPNGLHLRYIIEKTNGEKIDEDAEYFVLRLDDKGDDKKHIAACKKAILTYAEEIKDHMPLLSENLMNKYK